MAEQVDSRRGVLFGALLLGAGVAVALGVYGRVHTPNFDALPSLGFSGPGAFKAWTTSVILVLALFQLVSALWLYGRLGKRPAPSWLGRAHRASGALAFVLSLPVAYMCLYGLGFSPDPFVWRKLIHSIAGCAFYGAFAAKIVFVHTKRLPGWALPVAGGLLFTAIVVLWWTGARWYFGVEGLSG
jgi:phosphatidylglycerophosphate synthase